MENCEDNLLNIAQPSQSQVIVRRKRTFSESFVMGSGNVTNSIAGLQSTVEKLQAQVTGQKQTQSIKDIQLPEALQYDNNLNPKQIQEACQDMLNDSEDLEEQSSGNIDNRNSNEDLSSKKRKVTQAQMLGKTAGRWTKEEHKKFVQAIRLFGKDWRKVEDYVKTRSGAQIRSHAQKYFIRIQKKLKNGEALAYLNQTEDQCNTTRGLELFRQAISLYEDGSQKDQNEDDDDFTSASTIIKRQKLNHGDAVTESRRGTLNIIGERSMDINFNQGESPTQRQSLFLQRSEPLSVTQAQLQGSLNQQNLGLGSNYHFLSNEKKLVQTQFYEVVKRKEELMTEIYFNDKVDLFTDGRKYLAIIADLLNDIQKLSHKLTIINQISSMIDINLSQSIGTGNSILERMLILINEIMNLQKILSELVANNELFNKPLVKTPPQQIVQGTASNGVLNTQQQNQNQGQINNQLINLFSQMSPPQSQAVMQPPLNSQLSLGNLTNQAQISQLTQLLTGIVAQQQQTQVTNPQAQNVQISQNLNTQANTNAITQLLQQSQPTNTSSIPSASQLLRPVAQSQQTLKNSQASIIGSSNQLLASLTNNTGSNNIQNSLTNSTNTSAGSKSQSTINQVELLQKLKQIQMLSTQIQQQSQQHTQQQ